MLQGVRVRDDEEDEYDVRVREIVRDIEVAFADAPYPGDDNINLSERFGAAEDMIRCFKGRHWTEISPEELSSERFAIFYFTPEAFRFFLPAYMRANLLVLEVMDTAWEFTFGCLAPPEEGDTEGNAWFMARMEKLTPAERAAVRAYVDLYVATETSYPDPSRDRAVAFWSTF
jgi:hypothetical protein